MVDAALRAAGHRASRYTSPHLVTAERFASRGRPVSADALLPPVDDVRGAIDTLRREGTLAVQPTFFEVTTAVAFELFFSAPPQRANVEIAVLEVEWRGRLDATQPGPADRDGDHVDRVGIIRSTSAPRCARSPRKSRHHQARRAVVVGPLEAEAAAAIEQVAAALDAEVIHTSSVDVEGSRRTAGPPTSARTAAIAVRILHVLDVGASPCRRRPSQPPCAAAVARTLDVRRFADVASCCSTPLTTGRRRVARVLPDARRRARPLVFAAHARQNDRGHVLGAPSRRQPARRTPRVDARRWQSRSAGGDRARRRPSVPIERRTVDAGALALRGRLPEIVAAGSIFCSATSSG